MWLDVPYTARPLEVPGNLGVERGVVGGNDMAVEGRPLDDDGEFVRRACAGDADAYERLVELHQEVAVRVATLLCGPSAAPDATQEAFVKAWRALDRFRPGAPFRPWLLRIVANEARNARRGSGRRARLELREFEDRRSVGAAPSTEEAVLARERRVALLTALDQLSESDRDVISCRYLAELTEAETAAALGLRPGTVKSRLSRALGRLRADLDSAGLGSASEDASNG
jgi:RNA polymerase sigma factor (sigma-70 family)